jgi:hypothetical protein
MYCASGPILECAAKFLASPEMRGSSLLAKSAGIVKKCILRSYHSVGYSKAELLDLLMDVLEESIP